MKEHRGHEQASKLRERMLINLLHRSERAIQWPGHIREEARNLPAKQQWMGNVMGMAQITPLRRQST